MTDIDYKEAYADCLAELLEARKHLERMVESVDYLSGLLVNEHIGPEVLKKLRQRDTSTAYDWPYIDFLCGAIVSFGARGWPQVWRRLTRMVVITDEGERPLGDVTLLPGSPDNLSKGLRRYRKRQADRKI